VAEGVRGLEVSWIEAALGSASVILSGLAAYFAWRSYRNRPKLKLYVGDEANPIHYEKDLAYVHATLANVGQRAASNVLGRMEFVPGRVYPEKHIGATPANRGIDQHITATNNNWATLSLGTLAPNPYSAKDTLHARSFLDSPRHFMIPVRVAEDGPSRLTYWFVCDEGERIERTVTLDFPKQTTG
jgi:hypothetical protein